MLKLYQMFYAIWNHLYNLKNVKKTHEAMSLLVKLHTYITYGNIMEEDLSIDLSTQIFLL